MRYSVKIFSRIGELIQGIFPDRSPFLVSGLPSRTFFSEAALDEISLQSYPLSTSVQPHPQLPPKAHQALDLFLHRTNRELSGKQIHLRSNIPPGKGLSSSSTDILSVLYVANDYLQTGLTQQDLYSIAAQVEPTDPCLTNDIVLFKQRQGITKQNIHLPPVTLLWWDAAPDRQVLTLDVQRAYKDDAPGFFHTLLMDFLRSAEQQDYPALFECITRSAVYNQSVVPIPGFERYSRLSDQLQTGLMVAHSGTILGLLTPPEQVRRVLPEIQKALDHDHPTSIHIEPYPSPVNVSYVSDP